MTAGRRWRGRPAHRLALGAFAPLAMLSLAACTVNPATGKSSFTAFMSPEQEIEVGQEEHPKIVAEFGGAYDNSALASYVDNLGQRLKAESELPGLAFTFTVLDSDVVNAFALPGGYVYVTRGLLTLASSEAEIAGVLAHEIGHVTARHAAQRYSKGVAAGLFSTVIGAALGSEVGELAQFGAGAALQSHSRGQEFEADTLGVRYLSRTGYHTQAMASFLSKLQRQGELEALVTGQPDPAARYNIMSTHPRTADRVQAAIEAASTASVPNPRSGAIDYLSRLEGVSYGGSVAQGFVRGGRFVHSSLGFTFEVPPDFHLQNSPRRVVARNAAGATIVFDADGRAYAGSMAAYLTDVWTDGLTLADLETFDVNGLEAATARSRVVRRDATADLRLIAIRFGRDGIYRFLILTPPSETAALAEDLRRMTFSFRPLSEEERLTLRPRRIRVESVDPGETVATFAAQMAVDEFPAEWFQVLNGLERGEQPPVGSLVKLIVD
ncbi:MAG: M48 family metalloprotease [Alphaproteobacteria bacterium]